MTQHRNFLIDNVIIEDIDQDQPWPTFLPVVNVLVVCKALQQHPLICLAAAAVCQCFQTQIPRSLNLTS